MVNEYFARHPEMLLGEMKLAGTMYRNQEPTLVGNLTPELLAQAVASLPEGAFVPREKGRSSPKPVTQVIDASSVKQGGFALIDNELFVRNDEALEPAGISE